MVARRICLTIKFLTMTSVLGFVQRSTFRVRPSSLHPSSTPTSFLGDSDPRTWRLPMAVVKAQQSSTHESGLRSNDLGALDPLIVCGPSGVGKGTIIKKYMDEMGGNHHFGFTVSHTTRTPRKGEIDGIHYHFVRKEDMEMEIAENGFLEYAEVHGNFYGTSWSSLRDVQNGGKRCLLDIDVQGVQRIKELENTSLKPKYLFIAPPSLEILQQRLIGRGTESAESLERRISNAERELKYGTEAGNFHAVVINGALEKACEEFALAVQYLYNLQ